MNVKWNKTLKMDKNKNIQSEVEKTLKSLDNWKTIEADAFFYTRLSARLENMEKPIPFQWLFDLPLVKPALIVLTLFINLLSVNYILVNTENMEEQTSNFSTVFTDEYLLDQSTDSYLVFNDE